MKKTKIIATLWPATNSKVNIIKLYKAWINIIRFNFSHAEYKDVKETINLIKKLNKQWITKLSLLLDTKWPEIRTWVIKKEIIYKKWDIFNICINKKDIKENNLFCDYKYIVNDTNIWDIIKIDSWLFDVKIINKNKDFLTVKALNNAIIWSKRHINLPWVKLRLPWVTKKDKEDIIFWIKNNINFIAASFIRKKENILEIKKILKKYNAENISIISKIENKEWIDNLEEIVNYSDWIMIARWDLWIEVPIQKLPSYQRKIMETTKKAWKFAIIATHLLETMINSSFPTRAEISDIFNSIMEWSDSLMLSWETAIWKNPIKAVEIMKSTIKEAESIKHYKHKDFNYNNLRYEDIEKMVLIKNCIYVWEELKAKAFIIFTKSWLLAKLASSFKPNIPVIAFTDSDNTLYWINILFWINAIKLKWFDRNDYKQTLDKAINYLKDNKIISKKDRIITIYDIKRNGNDISTMKIINIRDW